MKGIIHFILSFTAVLIFCADVNAQALTASAVPQETTIKVDGVIRNCNTYNIQNYNYIKLRDMAAVFLGTDMEFGVRFDPYTNEIRLNTGGAYDAVPSGDALKQGIQTAVMSESSVFLDDTRIFLSTYNINGYNYFKIRDLAEKLGAVIEADGSSGNILITTKASNLEERDFGLGQIEEFTAVSMNGDVVNNSILQEKELTFIHYWATWCGPCRNELPEFKGLYDKYADKVTFVTVVDDGEGNPAADRFVSDYLPDYINVLPDAKLLSAVESGYVPTTVIVNKGGYLVLDKIIGGQGAEGYGRLIDTALSFSDK